MGDSFSDLKREEIEENNLTVGILALGLIGASFARAFKNSGMTVYGADLSHDVLEYALGGGIIDDILSDSNLALCDLVMLCAYPGACIDFLHEKGRYISKDALVMDTCGTKRDICAEGFRAAEEYGFTFAGGHPMAGTHFSGIKYSKGSLFKGAPMVIVPPEGSGEELIKRIEDYLKPAGFGMFSVTDAEEHDRMIAFTSQLAHVVSSAYIKSPTAESHKGFSAGSYKDLTRVAWLNPSMWSELFIENRDFLTSEIDCIIKALSDYRDAIDGGDFEKLKELLEDGKMRKERIDGGEMYKS